MRISAIQKSTLLDYPGKVATIIFTLGCNLRCRYCHNPEFVLPDSVIQMSKSCIPEDIFFRFLISRKNFLDGVVICGGEPTIQPDLIPFCRKIKELGFLIKLDTNGSNPHVIRTLLDENLLDYIAMDIKQAKGGYFSLVGGSLDESPYDESIALVRDRAPHYEFRTTVVSGYHTEKDMHAIGKRIAGAKQYTIQNFQNGNILDPSLEGGSFDEESLQSFQAIMSEYVAHCGIQK